MSVSIRPVRVQAVREAILACLAEPRSTAEIARRNGCSARVGLASGSTDPHVVDQLIRDQECTRLK